MNDKPQKNLKFTLQMFVVRVKSARINATKLAILQKILIAEHPSSVRTGKMHVLICYVFVYYVNSIHTGLFVSYKPRGKRGSFIKS